MRSGAGMLLGVGLGACLMYFLDPDRGRRRRHLLRDQYVHAGRKLAAAGDIAARDMQNRALGTVAVLQSAFDDSNPDDVVLVQRVRAHLGRACSHPGSIEVAAENGVVTLSGVILAAELDEVLHCVAAVRGVKSVANHLQAHTRPGNIPGLQGQTTRRLGERAAFLQSNWPPAARALGLLAGVLATVYGLGRRGLSGALSSMAGSTLILRSVSNLDLRRLTGLGRPRRAIDVQKTMHFNTPVARVFEIWANFENWPGFMKHVRQIRRLEDGRRGDHWRWTVDGPAGTTVAFDVAMTKFDEERIIRWRTERASAVQHAGQVRFFPEGEQRTRVDIKMTYNPIAGAFGHAIARLFNADPKHLMDDDLLRMKTWLEAGKVPHDAAQRRGNGHAAASPELLAAPEPGQPVL